jgi:hypothetical protein
MRARNLKPGFFKNEELAEIEPLGRILFEGLWCMADREGRLEDRPKRIKAEVLPYDNCDVNGLLESLAKRGFILRYSVNDADFIQINNFLKHQNPHPKEAVSEIPAPPPESHGNSVTSREIKLPVTEIPEGAGLIPSSLIPESPILNPDMLGKDSQPETPPAPPALPLFRVKDLALLWNDKAPPELSRVAIPFTRKESDLNKIRDAVKRHPEREWWERIILLFYNLPFVRGDNDRGWKITLDVMVRDAEKILDGKYASGSRKPKGFQALHEYRQQRR